VEIFGPSIAPGLAADRAPGDATSVVEAAEEAAEAALPGFPGGTSGDLAGEAQLHYDRAERALRDGDLVRFGEEWKKVGEALEKMKTK
jgi:hypothetical protein